MPLRVAFVHTPMAALIVPERRLYWRNFDARYHGAHPGLRQMRTPRWMLPQWMDSLAGVLVRDGYTDLRVLDLVGVATGPAAVDDLLVTAAVEQSPADVYLLSPVTANLPLALAIARLIKQTTPGATVVFGGVAATPLHRELAADAAVDCVVVGRGEVALVAVLRALAAGERLTSVGGVTCKSDDGSAVRPALWSYPALEAREIPPPVVDLFPADTGEDLRYLRQVYGLGCPYRCTFCTIQTNGRPPTYFPVDRVIAEIHAYRRRYGEHHNVYFGDETFGLDGRRLEELSAALAADGTIKYDCQTRLECLADAATRRLLKESGCLWVEVGLETKSQRSQDTHKQKQRIAQTEETLAGARDEGLAVCAFMMNGFPDQTIDDMRAAVEWVCGLLSDGLLQAAYFNQLAPYPGSALYARPSDYGMVIRHREWQSYNEEMPPVFDTPRWTSEAAHGVFLDGSAMIAEAMGGPSPGDEDAGDYGAFWDTAHV